VDFDLDDLDRITVGTIGEPGQRVFYLQARQGANVVSFKLEKQQVAALATYLQTLLADLPEAADEGAITNMDLDQPVEQEWVIGSIGVTYDEAADRVLIVAEELVLEEDEVGSVARLSATRPQIAALAARGAELVVAGRPPCTLCGNPLDPRGHVCPRLNGHSRPTP
jgi:uncharacterized repeat protein (TIGR03847 family)